MSHKVTSLSDHFQRVDDPRVDRTKRHLLIDILVIAICAVLCGADDWVAVAAFGWAKQAWFQTFLRLPNGIPAHDTFGRVFARLDPQQFQQAFVAWIQAVSDLTQGQVVAIDGKKLRRSHDQRLGKNAIVMVSAGALEFDAGLDSGRLLRALAVDDMALARQFVPWPFVGQPAVYMQGRYVRLEAGWEDALAQKSISVRQMNARPHGSGRWLCGMNERGRAVILHLSDLAPHFLIAGTTGSGKSVCLRSIVTQLSQRGDQLVLIDGKFGEGLRGLDHLPGVVGPLAVDMDTARSALAWTVSEMVKRYEQGDMDAARLCVVFDEVQELITDASIAEMVRRIAVQGRAARVSIILATQHPTTKALGDEASIKRSVTGRIALRVSDYKASEVAIGQNSPRADWLLGAGDAYAVVPGQVQRVQIAYFDQHEIDRLLTAQPAISEWPIFEAEALPNIVGWPSGEEVGVALLSAQRGEGRVKFQRSLKDAGLSAANDKAVKLLGVGRDALRWLEDKGYTACPSDEADTP